MWGGWYKDKDYMDLIAKTRAIYEKEQFSNIKSVSEIAVVLDENSSYFTPDSKFYKSVYDRIVSLGYIGAPYELLVSGALDVCDLERYKIVLFTAPVVTEKFRRLADGLKRDGKTIIATGDGGQSEQFLTTNDDIKISESIKNAGAHIYSAGNIVYANEKYLSVTARNDGFLTIDMPQECKLTDCISQKEYWTENRRITVDAQANSTFLFEISVD